MTTFARKAYETVISWAGAPWFKHLDETDRADVAATARAIEALEARAKAAENMLLSFTPSGSEYFLRDGPDGFRVDIEACARVIREQRMSGIEAKKECARLRKVQSNGIQKGK